MSMETGKLNAATESMKTYTAILKRSMAVTDTALPKIKSGFEEVGTALERVATVGTALKAPEVDTQKKAGDNSNGFNPFFFMKPGSKEKDKTKYDAAYYAKKTQFDNLIALAKEHSSKKIEIKEKEFYALKGFDDLHKASIGSLTAVKDRAYSAMEKQMLRLVETKKFSVKAFGTAVAQQVKLELVGLASKAAVWSLFEVAMGFKDLATPGMQGLAALHFKSAAEFAAVSGAALVGASAIQSVAFGGPKQGGATGSSGGASARNLKPANSLKSAVPVSSNVKAEQSKLTQRIKIVINNPLSDQNWQKIAEDNIAPALRDLQDRNIEVLVMDA